MVYNACCDRRTGRQFAIAHPRRIAVHQHDLIVAGFGKGAQLLYLIAMRAASIEPLDLDNIDLFGLKPIQKLDFVHVYQMDKDIIWVYRLNSFETVYPNKSLREETRNVVRDTRECE